MAQPFPTASPTRPELTTGVKKSVSERAVGRHDHPYMIRTTSSSLLTRSNSIGAVHKPTVHTSVTPLTPALGRSQGRGHKKTKSQSAVPPSLPLPPSTPTSPERPEHASMPPPLSPSPTASPSMGNVRLRVRRSETLPSIRNSDQSGSDSPFKLEDLPVWQLPPLMTSYLFKPNGYLPRFLSLNIRQTLNHGPRHTSQRTFPLPYE